MTNDQPDSQAAHAALAAAILTPDDAIGIRCQYVTGYQVGGVGGDREGHRCEAAATAQWVVERVDDLLLCNEHDCWFLHSPGTPAEYERIGSLL